MIIDIISNVMIIVEKNTTQNAKTEAKQKLEKSITLFLILGLVLAFILYLSYINMKETEKSKSYAAASGAMDMLSNAENY